MTWTRAPTGPSDRAAAGGSPVRPQPSLRYGHWHATTPTHGSASLVNWKKRFKPRRLGLILWKVDVTCYSRIVVQVRSPEACSLVLSTVHAKVRPKNWNTIGSGGGIALNCTTLCLAIDDSGDLQRAADIANGDATCVSNH